MPDRHSAVVSADQSVAGIRVQPARVNPKLLRAYDLRGTVGTELKARDAFALGCCYAARLASTGGRRVAVGYDGRLSSPMLENALVDGLVGGGAEVVRVGQGPTGMLYYAVNELVLDGGIMVTGSHNPADQNGFKLLLGREPVYGAALAALIGAKTAAPADLEPSAPGETYEPEAIDGTTLGHDARRQRGRSDRVAVEDRYLDRLMQAAQGLPALRIGWDAGNGATGNIVTRLAARLPGEHHLINCTIDGRFPAHHPDPSVPENLVQLQALVTTDQLDLGIAFDGDGDRIGVVDGTGRVVWADQLLLLLARDVLRDHPGATIVADVKSSRILIDGIAAAGGKALLSPSGYVLVRAAMLTAGAPLAGEMSGHIFFADRWYGTDDAVHVALRVLGAIGRSGGGLADFRAALPPSFATPELRIACPDEAKTGILAAVFERLAATGADVDRTDGLRVTTPAGWWLLRASGTEAKLTARVEAWSEAGLADLQAELFEHLAAAGLRRL